jgi:hypothetical protein
MALWSIDGIQPGAAAPAGAMLDVARHFLTVDEVKLPGA